MSEELIYLNNFPRSKGITGQKFTGTSELEKELLARGIIGKGIVTSSAIESSLEVEVLESRIKELESEIVSALEFGNSVKLELESVKLEKDNLFNVSEGMAKDIEELTSMLKESISLSVGQEPKGYKKYKG